MVNISRLLFHFDGTDAADGRVETRTIVKASDEGEELVAGQWLFVLRLPHETQQPKFRQVARMAFLEAATYLT
jgi:hypothetical protein